MADRRKREKKGPVPGGMRDDAAGPQGGELARRVLDAADEGFVVVDRNYRILTANSTFCAMVDASLGKILGRSCFEVAHGRRRHCFEEGMDCAVKAAFETGNPAVSAHSHSDREGNLSHFETRAIPLRDASGNVEVVVEVVRNMTEQELLAREQLRAGKLDAIGTLAGGIAHEFNNLLQGVFGYLSLARISLGDKGTASDLLTEAEKQLQRAGNLTRELLTFSKGGKPVKQRLSLAPIIESSTVFALSGSRVERRVRVDGDLWQVDADEAQVGQALQNIVLNASEAMPGGGVIEITAENVAAGGGASLLQKDGPVVRISIRDSGVGIPEQDLPRIFDPFFTTKQKGRGLGLATAYSIIKNHEGILTVDATSGAGTTFTLLLPAATGTRAAATPYQRATTPARKGRVLVMDDEIIVRELASKMIVSLGHEVEVAAHGGEALDRIEKARRMGVPFDIVILDLVVKGGMSGETVARKLAGSDPAVKVVVSSGYAPHPVVADFRTYGFHAVLKKPYTFDALRTCLLSLLA